MKTLFLTEIDAWSHSSPLSFSVVFTEFVFFPLISASLLHDIHGHAVTPGARAVAST